MQLKFMCCRQSAMPFSRMESRAWGIWIWRLILHEEWHLWNPPNPRKSRVQQRDILLTQHSTLRGKRLGKQLLKIRSSASLTSPAVYCCCCFKAWHSAEVWGTPSVCLRMVMLQEGVGAVSGEEEGLWDM